MGDRCQVRVEVRMDQEERFLEVTQWGEASIEEEREHGCVFLTFDEVNYGGLSELQDCAEAGLVFIAENEAGGDYVSSQFVALDSETWAQVHIEDGRVMIALGDDGHPVEVELVHAQEFMRIRSKVRALWESMGEV